MGNLNAKGSQMGNIYQYVLTLKLIIESNEDDVVYIEEEGDIAKESYEEGENISKEIKHHQGELTLGDHHIDLWKTLYNWCDKYEDYLKFNKLIFHTTAVLPDNSSFKDWNELTIIQRTNLIKELINSGTSQSTSKYRDFINKMDLSKFKSVLERVFISVNNPKILDLKNRLIKENGLFKLIKDIHNKQAFFDYLLGVLIGKYISSKEINISDFLAEIRPKAKSYQEYEYVISSFTHDPSFEKAAFVNDKFINELDIIGVDEHNKFISIQEFIYCKKVMLENAKNAVLLYELNNNILPSILSSARSKKGKYEKTKDSHSLFHEVIESEVNTSKYFENNKQFRNGNIHKNVNENEFSWLYT